MQTHPELTQGKRSRCILLGPRRKLEQKKKQSKIVTKFVLQDKKKTPCFTIKVVNSPPTESQNTPTHVLLINCLKLVQLFFQEVLQLTIADSSIWIRQKDVLLIVSIKKLVTYCSVACQDDEITP